MSKMAVLEAQCADEWQDIVSNCFIPLTCSAFEPGFIGKMEHVRLDERISVSSARSSGHIADRTARTARQADNDDLHVSLQISSSGVVSQQGNSTPVTPGSVVSYATDAAYHLDYSASGQHQVVIQVSRSSLGIPNRLIDDACRRLLVPTGRSTRTLYAWATSLQGRAVHATASGLEDLAETTRDLAATMFRSSFSSSEVMPQTGAGMLATIEEHLQHHADDPDLSLDRVAHSHYISRRKLYLLFEAAGTTPADHLRRIRLEMGAKLLREGRDPVTEIAFRVGFADPTTFARAFRREYGCNPRDYRRPELVAA